MLFELVRDGHRPGGVAPHAPMMDAEEGHAGGVWNWAGRSIRVPAGYLFVVAAVVVAAGLFGYVIGYGRAQRVAEAEAAERARQSVPENDPLTEAPLNIELTSPSPEGPEVRPASEREGEGTGPDAGSGSRSEAEGERGADAAGGDPREDGLNYFVLVRDLPTEGERLVSWLAERGVPAMTEPVSNGLVKVVVLQGVPGDRASSAQTLAFKQHLRELGARWKRDHRGSSDFSDLYLERHEE